MFRRLWSGLPKDPQFPSDLQELGYFVNDSDEIRSIKNPDNYFKFFISRNARYNERQRFAMNEACEKLVHERLENLGLKKTLLPLGTTDTSQPHIPIFVSSGIKEKSRVVVIFGETYQDLGVVAHRVLGGRGGVDKGSMVGLVKSLLEQPSSCDDPSPPGVVIANAGQTLWSPELRRPLTLAGSEGAPMPSAVHAGICLKGAKNQVPENGNAKEHIKYIFEKVVPAFVGAKAGLDILAVGDAADAVEQYLDWSTTWGRLGGMINCMAIVGGYHPMDELKCEAFAQFLREKARGWSISHEPLGTPISGPDGNPNTSTFTRLGFPLFSGGESHFIETLLIHSRPHVVAWLEEVALAPARHYRNPIVAVVDYADPAADLAEPDWSKWQNAPLDQQPPIDFGFVDPRADISSEEEGKEGKEDDEDEKSEAGLAELEAAIDMFKLE